ncbi:MAG: hypothetical protein H0Z29_11620 [Candidatus Marinimicrobia bacterium]|nr:hypothetical protein [Candidatus Neomarinimicrobiota bacterium]
MPVVTVKKPLREKLGDDGIEALVELINEAQKETKNNVIQFVEEKFEKRLSEELAKVRVELTGRIEGVRTELKSEIESLRSEMKSEIENLRSEMKSEIEGLRTNDERIKTELIERIEKKHSDTVKWMFIFWVGQIGAILGILFAFFKG